MKKEITGVMVYYYEVCKRKLWYFYNEIQMEQGNENVAIGKTIDEETYSRDEKHINIDNIINIINTADSIVIPTQATTIYFLNLTLYLRIQLCIKKQINVNNPKKAKNERINVKNIFEKGRIESNSAFKSADI